MQSELKVLKKAAVLLPHGGCGVHGTLQQTSKLLFPSKPSMHCLYPPPSTHCLHHSLKITETQTAPAAME